MGNNNSTSSSSSNNNNMTLINWMHQLQEWWRHVVPPVSFQDWPVEKKNEFCSFVREFGSISINASSDVLSHNGSSSSSCMRSFGMSSSSSSTAATTSSATITDYSSFSATVDWFLHGRYLIARDLTFDYCASNGAAGAGRVTMFSSNDLLVHLVLHSQGSA